MSSNRKEFTKNAELIDKYLQPFKDKPIRALIDYREGAMESYDDFTGDKIFCFEVTTKSYIEMVLSTENFNYPILCSYTFDLYINESDYQTNNLIKKFEKNPQLWCKIRKPVPDDDINPNCLKATLHIGGRTMQEYLDKYDIKENTDVIIEEVPPTSDEIEIQNKNNEYYQRLGF